MKRTAWLLALLLLGCADDRNRPRPDAGSGGSTDAGHDAPSSTIDSGGIDASSAITADMIRAALGATCTHVSTGLYATDEGEPETIPICQGPGAVLYWNSDIDVDCDGGRTTTCTVDPAYQSETSATGSDGMPIDAETVPFVVIPLPSARFRYPDHAIDVGQLAVVTYGDRWAIGVFADEGPEGIIGEASYAMNVLLGVDPNPITGGADSGATFVIFTGATSRIDAIEDHAAAVSAAMPLLHQLVGL